MNPRERLEQAEATLRDAEENRGHAVALAAHFGRLEAHARVDIRRALEAWWWERATALRPLALGEVERRVVVRGPVHMGDLLGRDVYRLVRRWKGKGVIVEITHQRVTWPRRLLGLGPRPDPRQMYTHAPIAARDVTQRFRDPRWAAELFNRPDLLVRPPR